MSVDRHKFRPIIDIRRVTVMTAAGSVRLGALRRRSGDIGVSRHWGRRTSVPAELVARAAVSERTLLRWRRHGWLGPKGLWADTGAGWADPEVVAQVAWLAQINQMKSERRIDAADVDAGPLLRSLGWLYGWRAADGDGWQPIDDPEQYVAAMVTLPAVLVARVLPTPDKSRGFAS